MKNVERELAYWSSVWGDTLARAKPPYRGVNLINVKKEFLDPTLESLRDQTDYIHKIGGKMYSLTMREFDDHYKIIWCFDYPEDVDWTDPAHTEITLRNGMEVCPAMFEIIESYDWFLLESGSWTFPETSADIFRQIPPPSEEKLSELMKMIEEMKSTMKTA